MSKSDYLKKYVGGGKKKTKPAAASDGLKIIDEDVDWRSLKPKTKAAGGTSKFQKTVTTVEDDDDKEIEARVGFVRVQPDDGSGWVEISGPTVKHEADLSPVRKRAESPRRMKNEDSSPPRRGAQDSSPPRRRTQDSSPPRRGAQDSSPPRRRTQDSSPPRKKRTDSPPRKKTADSSPPRKPRSPAKRDPSPRKRKASNDLSPARNKAPASPEKAHSRNHTSPSRKIADQVKVEDSAPSSTRRHDSESPKRRKSASPKQSPKRKRHDSASPQRSSPVRKRHDSTSPPRRSRSPKKSSPKRRSKSPKKKSSSPPKHKAGLRDAKEFSKEAQAALEKQRSKLGSLTEEESGKHAATVVRDKSGRKVADAELTRMKNKEHEKEEEKLEWGKGLAQKQAQEDRIKELADAKNAPFARYKNDAKLNAFQASQDRWGDPMLSLNKSTKKDTTGQAQVEALPAGKRQRPRYKGDPWINRFGIQPGYRWDGFDRGTGWEPKMFLKHNTAKVREEEAYKWSSEDM